VEKFVGDADLYFSPTIPAFPTKGALVVAIMDMVWQKFPHFYPARTIWTRRKDFGRVVRQARGILTISEASRRDILEASGLPEHLVRSVHLGLDDRFRTRPSAEDIESVLSSHQVAGRYVLAVAGDNSPKKNLSNLVRAMAALDTKFDDVTLVNVGVPRYDTKRLDEIIRETGMTDRAKFLGRVSDDELRALYAGARLTAYPSHYEGFGFPVVESMGLGTPVVTSNVSSMPEVAGDAALLADPNSVEELAGAIGQVLGDDALHADLTRKGLANVKRFTWEACARGTRDFFAEVAGD
jgi:alpha-1,3-rhamnosyl/mannosyltransferase